MHDKYYQLLQDSDIFMTPKNLRTEASEVIFQDFPRLKDVTLKCEIFHRLSRMNGNPRPPTVKTVKFQDIFRKLFYYQPK